MPDLKDIPTESQIRDYVGLLGPIVDKAFIQGFISGWWARHNGFNPNDKEDQ